jgi:SAM-dependent methyltransferase
MTDVRQPDYWENLYAARETPWDLEGASPALADWLAANPGAGQSVAVLGAGHGHDAIAFAEAGYAVTAVDFAPSAIRVGQEHAEKRGVEIRWVASDLFALLPEHAGAFDLVVEHTCFCAIDPTQRGAYVETVAGLLKPGGRLIAVFFTHGKPGGPPFGASPGEIERGFGEAFAIRRLEPASRTIPRREGQETFGELVKREPGREKPADR